MREVISQNLKTFIILMIGMFILSLFPGLIDSRSAAEDISAQGGQKDVKRISPVELKKLMDRGETVLIVDVRSTAAYNNQHISGALSVPVIEVESRLSGVPPLTKIVFY